VHVVVVRHDEEAMDQPTHFIPKPTKHLKTRKVVGDPITQIKHPTIYTAPRSPVSPKLREKEADRAAFSVLAVVQSRLATMLHAAGSHGVGCTRNSRPRVEGTSQTSHAANIPIIAF